MSPILTARPFLIKFRPNNESKTGSIFSSILSIKTVNPLIKFLYALSYYPAINIEKLNESLYYLADKIEIDSDVVKQLAAQYRTQRKTYSYSTPKSHNSYNDNKSIYSIFGLTADCTEKQLKKAYHDLAKKYHPDTNSTLSQIEKNKSQEKLREIIVAYEEIKKLNGWR